MPSLPVATSSVEQDIVVEELNLSVQTDVVCFAFDLSSHICFKM